MSANFKLYGNMPVSNDSFRRFCETLVVVSELIFITFGELLFMVDDFLAAEIRNIFETRAFFSNTD